MSPFTTGKYMAILIYITALFLILTYSLKHKIGGDFGLEYRMFLDAINGKRWMNDDKHVLLVWTILPILLSRFLMLFRLKPETAFKVAPALLYAMMPVFTYLIVRGYVGVVPSIVASGLVLSGSYFMFYPNIGRMGMGYGLLSVILWALLTDNLIVALVAGFLLVFAHYSTTFYFLCMGGIVSIAMLIFDTLGLTLIITLGVVGVTAIIWYGLVSSKSANTVLNTIMMNDGFFDINSREQDVKAAFGIGWGQRTLPDKLEIIVNWCLVGFLTYSLSSYQVIGLLHYVLALVSYGLIVLVVIIPSLSNYYGVGRTIFASLILLAPALVVLIPENLIIILVVFILIYACVTSGLVHRLLRHNKKAKLAFIISRAGGDTYNAELLRR